MEDHRALTLPATSRGQAVRSVRRTWIRAAWSSVPESAGAYAVTWVTNSSAVSGLIMPNAMTVASIAGSTARMA